MSELVQVGAIAACAAVLSVVATPMFGAFARRHGMLADPRADRWGGRQTPLLGGAAIGLAALTTIGVFLPDRGLLWPVLGAASAALVFGLIDDFRHLAPTTKLVGQVLIGGALVFGGVQSTIIELPAVAFLLTVFWVVGMMNALNLMDNMDGVAAGITAIAATVLAVTALPESFPAAVVAAATAGAALGFLSHNFPPARIFMGDAGSQLLGLLLATAALMHTASGAANVGLALLGPLVVLALPIFDTLFVMVSRRLAGVPLSRGGRDHTSHRLAALGMSDRVVALTLYSIAASLALLGVLTESLTNAVFPLVAVAAIALLLFAAFLVGVEVYPRSTETGQQREQTHVLRAMTTLGRFGLEVGVDVVLLTVAYFAAFLVRFEGVTESAWMPLFVRSMPLVVGIQLASLVALRVYRTLWRYFVISDALAIIRAISVGTALAVLVLVLAFRFDGYSRAVFAIDWLFAAALVIGARAFSLWLRHALARLPRADDSRVLIVGANDTGAIALRLLQRVGDVRYRAIGFLDDDPGKRYRRVAGVPIVGMVNDLEELVGRSSVDLIVLASDDPSVIDRVRAVCARAGVPCRDLAMKV